MYEYYSTSYGQIQFKYIYKAKKNKNIIVYEPNSLIKDIYYSIRAIL